MIEIARILCPVDFSDTSSRALDVATAAARWYGARLDVLHVHQEQLPVDIIPSLAAAPAVQYASREAVHAEIHSLATRFVERALAAGVPVDLAVRDHSSVHEAILEYAAQRRPDLIVLGTHGRSGLERWLLGSTADRIVRTASCPVMVVPPRADNLVSPGDVEFDSILCGVDFSEGSLSALEWAMSLAEEADAHLTLLNVIEVPPELEAGEFSAPADVAAVRAEAEARRLVKLRELVPDAVREYSHVHTAVAEGSAYREILRAARERRSDLIVVGTQGRGAVDRLVFGSNAQQVIRAAPCAVLTVPAGGGR
jgi:nucleotide-binding universal stress UspA family protein